MREQYQVEFSKRENGYDAHLVPCGNEVQVVLSDTAVVAGNVTLHRDNVISTDKILPLANTDLATADNGAGTGSLNQSTTYYLTAIPGNAYGPCSVAATINTQATAAYGANTGSIRLTIPQRTGATVYHIFCSTAAAPLYVAQITEAQRAGGCEITAVGTVNSPAAVAGAVDIQVAGTGLATSAAQFAQNNAYLITGIPQVNCAGHEQAIIYANCSVTDLRSAPSFAILPFLGNPSDGNYYQGVLEPISVITALGQSFLQAFIIDVKGHDLKVAVDTIGGQGASIDIYVLPI